MRLYDISQEVFSCAVYPGNPGPERQILGAIDSGYHCNMSAFSMCAHNGTHIDSPYHFLGNGKTVDQMELEIFVGDCYVARHKGDVSALDAETILTKAAGAQRILIAGPVTVTAQSAEVFAASGIKLIGIEGQAFGQNHAPKQVHVLLLGRGIALLEGAVLKDVPEGHYFLSAAPLNRGGCDGAPCRAYLIAKDI